MEKIERCVQLIRMNVERKKLPFDNEVIREAIKKIKLKNENNNQ